MDVCFLLFERMTDIEKRFAGDGDGGSLIEIAYGPTVRVKSLPSPPV
jgi:hypothetical protein